MNIRDVKHERILEVLLVLSTVALACVLAETVGMKLIVLNLFYLPVVMADSSSANTDPVFSHCCP